MNFICLLTGLVFVSQGCKLFFDLKEARKIEPSYIDIYLIIYILLFFWIEMSNDIFGKHILSVGVKSFKK